MTNKLSLKKSGRQRAREFALQAVYQWIVNPDDVVKADEHTRGLSGFNKVDLTHYETIVHGTAQNKAQLLQEITPLLDRKMADVSPVELSILLLGSYELQYCLEVPYRVVINEYIEVTKNFGGEDGFRYVNGVLHKLAQQFRRVEI